jgi:2-amino-4-hydroxy-6-hydroxymethyldihydropteridine diphosphokinase
MRLLDKSVVSGLYRTAPQVDTDQDEFWNAAVAGDWDGTPESLLERLLMYESGEGRLRDPLRPKGPRVLDLDLLVFGDLVLASPRLTVPHASLGQRRFALEPLIALEASARDPRTGELWSQLMSELPPQGVDLAASTW